MKLFPITHVSEFCPGRFPLAFSFPRLAGWLLVTLAWRVAYVGLKMPYKESVSSYTPLELSFSGLIRMETVESGVCWLNTGPKLPSQSYTWMLFPPFPPPPSIPSDCEEDGREFLERGWPFSPRGVPKRWLIWDAVSSDSQRSNSSRTSRSICSRWISLSRPSLSS